MNRGDDAGLWEGMFTAASHYCETIEARGHKQLEVFLRDCLISLTSLINLASSLPEIDSEEDDPPLDTLNSNDWQDLFDSLRSKLGRADQYCLVFNSYEDKQAIYGSLSDDLSDIYYELKNGLLAIDNGSSRSNVIWQWRWMFWTHWGCHAVNSVKAIHDYLSEKAEP